MTQYNKIIETKKTMIRDWTMKYEWRAGGKRTCDDLRSEICSEEFQVDGYIALLNRL